MQLHFAYHFFTQQAHSCSSLNWFNDQDAILPVLSAGEDDQIKHGDIGGIVLRVKENIFSWSDGDKDYRVSGLVQRNL